MPLISGFSISFHAFQDTLIHAVFKSKTPLVSLHVTKVDKTHRLYTPYVGAKMVSSRIHIGEVGSSREHMIRQCGYLSIQAASSCLTSRPPTIIFPNHADEICVFVTSKVLSVGIVARNRRRARAKAASTYCVDHRWVRKSHLSRLEEVPCS